MLIDLLPRLAQLFEGLRYFRVVGSQLPGTLESRCRRHQLPRVGLAGTEQEEGVGVLWSTPDAAFEQWERLLPTT